MRKYWQIVGVATGSKGDRPMTTHCPPPPPPHDIWSSLYNGKMIVVQMNTHMILLNEHPNITQKAAGKKQAGT